MSHWAWRVVASAPDAQERHNAASAAVRDAAQQFLQEDELVALRFDALAEDDLLLQNLLAPAPDTVRDLSG
jgi:hypothetical protein